MGNGGREDQLVVGPEPSRTTAVTLNKIADLGLSFALISLVCLIPKLQITGKEPQFSQLTSKVGDQEADCEKELRG